MRTVSYRLGDLARATINIGKVAENEYTRVQFNAEQIFAEYPAATAALNVINPAGTAYPAVVTREGDLIIWDVTDTDLTAEGMGELQLTLTENGVVCKSFIARTRIERSIVASGSTPDPVQNWLDNAAEVLEQVEDAIPAGGTQGQVLGKLSDDDYDMGWIDQTGGGGGGTSNYNDLSNKPQIAGTTLSGNKTLEQLGIAAASDIPDVSGFYTKPQTGIPASDIESGVIPVLTDLIDDTAGDGDTDKVWSADKSAEEVSTLSSAIMTIGGVTPEQYGAKGDGTTDDSAAVQDACDAGYEVRFASNKTYYLASPVTIDHDCHLIGGENTVIKTKTPTGGTVDNGIVISGTLKKTTTLTSDYVSDSTSSENAGNRFKLTDMTGINAGDIMIITATDQHFSYNRPYYYMGGTLLIAEVVDGYLYTADTMPWDIENTANVSVRIYDAPVASVENLRFESDLDSSGSYKYPINLYQCKNSSVKNCTIKNMDNGLNIHECVNTLVDCVSLAYTPGMSGNTDHYGIAIYACNNTTISRVLGECANSCVDLSGNTPNMNTLITRSCLYGSNRVQGIGMHENAYNTVVTDSVIGGMIGYGTLIIERCRFVCRNRQSDSGVALTYRGDYDEKYSKLTIKDCTIEGEDLAVAIAKPSVSSPVQAYNHVVGEVYIENVTGGYLQYIPTSDSTILSNTIRKLIIKNWTNVKEIYHTSGSIIDYMLLENCQINHRFWINAHNYTFCFDGIGFLRLKNESPKQDRLYVDLKKNGGRYLLASGVPVSVSSSNSDAHYVICGNNIASNDATDYDAGSVSGSVGGALTRTHNSYRENDLSVNGNGQVVITNSSGSVCSFFLKCMVYVAEQSNAVISMKVKNTGSVSGVKCRPSIAVLDADTLLVTGISQATATEATSQGASVSHNRSVPANSFVQFYIYFNNPVNGAETTLEELSMTLTPEELPVPTYEEYQGDSITGNGTIYSVNGANNLMCSNNVFNANFKVDYVSNPV